VPFVNLELQKMPADEYHARSEYSHSNIKLLMQRGPWQFYSRVVTKDLPDEATDAMSFGSSFHAYMEDPDAWKSRFVSEPVRIDGDLLNKRLKKHREALAAWEEDMKSQGKIVVRPNRGSGGDPTVSPEEAVMMMAESILDNHAAGDLVTLQEGYQEIAGFAVDQETGLCVRALADLWLPEWNDGGATIVDFKTTDDDTPEEWSRKAIYNWGYDHQAAWYTDLFRAEKFVFIVVRKRPPWESWVLNVPKDVIAVGRRKNIEGLRKLKSCLDAGDWHNNGYGGEYNLLEGGRV